jgi:aldehyde dehydrogenase (NAD+)
MSIAEKFLTLEYGPAPEDPKDALLWLDRHQRRFGHFIGGAWRQPIEGGFFDSTDPSTGEKIATVAQGSAADIDAAVQAARSAFPQWQALAPHARARHLYAFTSTITPAGHSYWILSSRTTQPAESSDRSSRGIFRY